MTRSMRVMFLALIAALLAGVVTLRVKNDALSHLSPSPATGQGPGADGTEGEKGRGEGKP